MIKTTVIDKEKRVVIVTNGIATGMAKCRKGDVFDVTVGKRLANARYEDDVEAQATKIFGYNKIKGVVPLATNGAKAFEEGRIYKLTTTDATNKIQYIDFSCIADVDEELSILDNDGNHVPIKEIITIKKTKFRVGDKIIVDGEMLEILYQNAFDGEFYCANEEGDESYIRQKDVKKGRKEYKKIYGGKK